MSAVSLVVGFGAEDLEQRLLQRAKRFCRLFQSAASGMRLMISSSTVSTLCRMALTILAPARVR